MRPRLLHSEVKEYIHEAGEKLITETYIGVHQELSIECSICGKVYTITFKQYQKGMRHNICTSNHIVWNYPMVKEYIEKQGDLLISQSYTNTRELLIIRCHMCSRNYNQTFMRYKTGFRDKGCPSRPRMIKDRIDKPPRRCKHCNIDFVPKDRENICSIECLKAYMQYRIDIGYYKYIGSIGGKVSASVQNRRSKNEIMFAELCQKYLIVSDKDRVLTNDRIFNGWDADVIILHMKLAVHWNGQWHYVKLRAKHDVEDVQRRDKLKYTEIEKCGYTNYIIKDMGGENDIFVKEEFNKFLLFISLFNFGIAPIEI